MQMLDDNGSDSEELQEQTRPFKAKISSIIWSYSLICGAVVLLAGYAALVGTLAEELSKQIIWLLSITLAVIAGLALLVGVPAIALREFVTRRDSNVVLQKGAGLVGDIVALLCILPLLLFSMGVVITLLQLSTGQFLTGDEETRYRHLMMLSAYAGAFFGISAGWKSKRSYEMGWAISIWHGARIFLEAAFLAYAGLWLSIEPFEYAATQAKEANWNIFAITLLVLQRQFREGCGVMPAWRRGAWHGSVWPVRYCPAYPQATAATRLARTVPGAAFPAPPGRPAAS